MTDRQGGGWQLAEDAAEAYERYLVPIFFAPWADRLLVSAGVRAGDRVLDVACGTGSVARCAAARVGPSGAVSGLDLNDGMLAVARRVTGAAGLAIAWRQGDAAALPFPDGSFDVVVCQQALQFIADPVGALREMRRVLGPGGRVALSVLRPIRHSPAYVPIADALERHAGAEAGAIMRSIFPAWTRGHLRAMAVDGGFDDAHVRIEVGSIRYPSPEEFLRREAACSPLAATLRALPDEARERLVRDLDAALAAHLDDDGIESPMETWVVVAGQRP